MPAVETPNEKRLRLRFRCHKCRCKSPTVGEIQEGGTGWAAYRIDGWSLPQWFCGNCPHPNAPTAPPAQARLPGSRGRASLGDTPRRRALVYLRGEESGRLLWAFGKVTIAAAAGGGYSWIDRAIAHEHVDPLDLLALSRWIIERRVYKENLGRVDTNVGAWILALAAKVRRGPEETAPLVLPGEVLQRMRRLGAFRVRLKGGRSISLDGLLRGFDELGFRGASAILGDDKHVSIHNDQLSLRAASIVLDYMRRANKRTISTRSVRSLVLLGRPYSDRTRLVQARARLVEGLTALGLAARATHTGIDLGGIIISARRGQHLLDQLGENTERSKALRKAIEVLAEDGRAFKAKRQREGVAAREKKAKNSRAAARAQKRVEQARAEATGAETG